VDSAGRAGPAGSVGGIGACRRRTAGRDVHGNYRDHHQKDGDSSYRQKGTAWSCAVRACAVAGHLGDVSQELPCLRAERCDGRDSPG
jgi:hypothetical protein